MKLSLSGCLGSLGILAIFGLIGAGLSYWGWTILQDAKASASWPTASGLVTSSEVSHSTDSDGNDSYSPEVDYQYQVDGQSIVNSQIKFGENSYGNRRKAEEIAGNYPVGQQVTVYYDPERPDKAVLEPGVTAGSYIVLGIGVFFILVSLVSAPIRLFSGRN
ncbi:MAG: DUF3592 domain-containing protein [Candidatus Promineifilaceae bacterium]